MSEANERAANILREAGWLPHDGWGVYTRDTLVMGFTPDGLSFYAKNWAAIPPGHPQHGADTPDTAEEAAAWLVEHRKPAPPMEDNPLSMDSLADQAGVPLAPDDQQIEVELAGEAGENFAHETHGETGEVEASVTDAPSDDGYGDVGRDLPEEAWPSAAGDDPPGGHLSDPIDADFTTLEIPEEPPVEEFGAELLDDYPATAPPLLEGAETSEPPTETSGPIAYAASDLDALVREKLGRLSQIARELKALLQDGWTTEEFASKQSYVVGNTDTFGAFIGDQAIYDRFVEMSNLQGAQRRVEMHRELLEAELELIGQHRDYAGAVAFDPERLRDEQWMFGG